MHLYMIALPAFEAQQSYRDALLDATPKRNTIFCPGTTAFYLAISYFS